MSEHDKEKRALIKELTARISEETVAERRILYKLILADAEDCESRSMEGVSDLGINETVASAFLILALQSYHCEDVGALLSLKTQLDEMRQTLSGEMDSDPMSKILKEFKDRNYEA